MGYKQSGHLARIQPDRPGIPGRRSELVRFLEKVAIEPGTRACWIWKAAVEANGYGYFRHSRGKYAHRAAYELFVAPIPEGMTVDHLCENKLCVKPDHLDLAEAADNVERSGGRWTTCDRYHPDAPTTFKTKPAGRAYCGECHRIQELNRRRRRRGEAVDS